MRQLRLKNFNIKSRLQLKNKLWLWLKTKYRYKGARLSSVRALYDTNEIVVFVLNAMDWRVIKKVLS